jgi:hypothetical protein
MLRFPKFQLDLLNPFQLCRNLNPIRPEGEAIAADLAIDLVLVVVVPLL